MNINQHNYSESTIQIREENEHLKTKIFMVEQLLQKKENIINRYRTKISLYKNGYIYNQREIYVTNPSKLINQINNELLTYKEMYEKTSEMLKDSRTVIEKYENQIICLQNENQSLRQEYKNHIFSTNRERETLMTTIQKERVQLRSITEDNANSRRFYDNDAMSEDFAWKNFQSWMDNEDDYGKLGEKFTELTKDMPNPEHYYMHDFEDLFVWNDLVHCFDYEHHHKSILTDGSEVEWFWSWKEKTEKKEDGNYYKTFGYERIRIPLEKWRGNSFTTWIPDSSIKEDIY